MKNLSYIIKGVAMSFMILILLIVVFAAILSLTNISDNYIKPVLIGITFFSIMISSFLTLRKIKSKGVITGLILAGSFLLVLLIISFIMNGKLTFDMYSYMTILFGILSGMIGGILGVNIK